MTVCDMCGREINPMLTGYVTMDLRKGFYKDYYDMCEYCTEKLQKFIRFEKVRADFEKQRENKKTEESVET